MAVSTAVGVGTDQACQRDLPSYRELQSREFQKQGGVVLSQHVSTGVGSSWRGEEASVLWLLQELRLTPRGAKCDFSHKRAHSFTGLCSSFQYENYFKTWLQLIELKILFLSQSKFLFQNKLWYRGWNRSQTTWKWMWRVYCLSSKDLCRATTWVHDHESVKKMRKFTSPQ